MSTVIPIYPFDPDGDAVTNLVHEQQPLESNGVFDYFYVMPRSGPFYAGSVKLKLFPGGIDLIEGKDYNFGHHFMDASHTIGQAIYGSITFYDHTLKGILDMEYQTLGGVWMLDEATILEILANEIRNPRITSWETIVELPERFPVVNHKFDIEDFVGMSDVTEKLEGIEEAIKAMGNGAIDEHVNNKANPHEVTKTQVGLGLVDNYPTASIVEAQAGTANNRFMTALRVRQAIEAIATTALNTHLADLNNPHQVTKAQVGLGLVQNLQLPTQAEAEAASSNARYMTPLRTREAVMAIVGNDYVAHAANLNNPHQVNKGHVGLGSVQNYPLASQAEAEAGTSNQLYMTPLLTRYIITAMVGTKVDGHIADKNNPHMTTAAQIGLGLVQNFGVASEAEARDATVDNKYMTPLKVRQAINELVGDAAIGEHVTNFSNPHQVTAAQVGAPSLAAYNQAMAGKLGTGETAANSNQLFGMNQTALQAWIAAMTVANATNVGGLSVPALTAQILTGKAADSNKLDGKTYADIYAAITSNIAGSSIQYTIPEMPLVIDGANGEVQPPRNWVQFGIIKQPTSSTICDFQLMLTGGRNDESLDDELQCNAILTVSANAEVPDGGVLSINVKHAELKYLNAVASPIKVGYRSSGTGANAILELWVEAAASRTSIIVTELSYNRFTLAPITVPELLSEVTTVRPTGLVDADVISDGRAEATALNNALNAFIARRDNPHQVTKAQVGLALTPNYAAATDAVAAAGTSTNTVINPKQVSDRINVITDAILVSMTSTLNDCLADFA
jgi:hypothetical protein